MLFFNLNSEIHVLENEELFTMTRVANLFDTYKKSHTYLINTELMDYLSPPKYTYDENCLSEFLHYHENEHIEDYYLDEETDAEREDKFWENISKCKVIKYVALAVYFRFLSDSSSEYIKSMTRIKVERERCIFLSPYRIMKSAKKISSEDDFQVYLAYVLYHELNHALLDTHPALYGTEWGSIIEESFANAEALFKFWNIEYRNVEALINKQQIEYRGALYLHQINKWDYNILSCLSI